MVLSGCEAFKFSLFSLGLFQQNQTQQTMKKFSIAGLIFLQVSILISCSYAQETCKEVIGYYPNWQWYDRNKLVNPSSIQYDKYSIINYAFFSPEADGTIAQTDTWADENLLLGEIIWYPVESNDFSTSIIYKAHESGTKVLPSIGGWTLSNNFSQIAADPVKRQNFALACINLIQTFQFDGIDIDWEYPGFAEHNGTPADKENFTSLMMEIRNALDSLSGITGNDYLLTACFSADPPKMEYIEYGNLVDILDMFNMMTYDFSGTFDAVANHNSPLYAPTQGDSEWNLDRAFYNVTQLHGVPPEKVNLGVAFYGRSMTNCAGLFETHSGLANTSLFAADEGSPLYYNVLESQALFTNNWDDQAKVPFLTDGPDATFVTFDDENSVRLKAEYIRDSGAGGAIIWEITGDYLESYPGSGIVSATPLLDALNEGLCIPTKNETLMENELVVFPNPAKDYLFICNAKGVELIEIFNDQGYLICKQVLCNKTNKIPVSSFSSGIYFYRLTSRFVCNTGSFVIVH
ncbi:MAG: hypothetical protein C0594_06815 [Marinilabiliales bacterium]|nr:MAG: hypothetical protein C0594_06815 [Marinilabiliales bacterium]